MSRELYEGLAAAFLDGEWVREGLRARAQAALGSRPRWLGPLCRRVLLAFAQPPLEVAVLAGWLQQDKRLAARFAPSCRAPRIRRWFMPPARMARPPAALGELSLPELRSTGELAQALSVAAADLSWFADVSQRNRARAAARLQHYHRRWIEKRSGGYRLLETPKPRIKQIQRWLLRELLSAVPLDAAAHGFARGRSVLSFVAPHVGQAMLVRLDLEDFFASIEGARVRGLFRMLGYPTAVAATLAGLCSVATPESVLRACPDPDPAQRYRAAQRLRVPHLAQGAPTSPALSNLIAYRLDRRLTGLAATLGLRYTRYADDLAFSGDRTWARRLDGFVARVAAIAEEEGFRLRMRKLRVMPGAGRQRLAGLVVNARTNVARREYDALRATLHNARRFGPASQNRANHPDFRAHLAGRIAWVEQTHATRGARLRAAFDRIAWNA